VDWQEGARNGRRRAGLGYGAEEIGVTEAGVALIGARLAATGFLEVLGNGRVAKGGRRIITDTRRKKVLLCCGLAVLCEPLRRCCRGGGDGLIWPRHFFGGRLIVRAEPAAFRTRKMMSYAT